MVWRVPRFLLTFYVVYKSLLRDAKSGHICERGAIVEELTLDVKEKVTLNCN